MKYSRYNYTFKIPHSETLLEVDDLNMVELCETLIKNFKEFYDIDIKITRNVIHNLTRKISSGCNKIILDKVKIYKIK
jgi:hypothetical protein